MKKIIFIKIIQYIENLEIILITSDIQGKLFLVRINLNDLKPCGITNIFSLSKKPIYNIELLLKNKDNIKQEKNEIYMVLSSSQIVEIVKLDLTNDTLEELKKIENFFSGNELYNHFDITIGTGFPPIPEFLPEINEESKGSNILSRTITRSYTINMSRTMTMNNIILNEDIEEYFLAVSYGHVIKLYEIKKSSHYRLKIKEIGHYINDINENIIRIAFMFNSMIALINEKFQIKMLNTYDFVSRAYNPQSDKYPTRNSLISYDILKIKEFDILGDQIEFDNRFTQNIYNNKIIKGDEYMILVGKDKIYKCSLLKYDIVLHNLLYKGKYKELFCLSCIIYNKNENLLQKQLLNDNRENLNEQIKNNCGNYITIIGTELIKYIVSNAQDTNNLNNIIYILEFMIETDNSESLPVLINLMKEYNIEKYLFTYLTKYIIDGRIRDIINKFFT